MTEIDRIYQHSLLEIPILPGVDLSSFGNNTAYFARHEPRNWQDDLPEGFRAAYLGRVEDFLDRANKIDGNISGMGLFFVYNLNKIDLRHKVINNPLKRLKVEDDISQNPDWFILPSKTNNIIYLRKKSI
jgi:hypothetical protein